MAKIEMEWEIPLEILDSLAESKHVDSIMIAPSPRVGYLHARIRGPGGDLVLEGYVQDDATWQATGIITPTEDWPISSWLVWLKIAMHE